MPIRDKQLKIFSCVPDLDLKDPYFLGLLDPDPPSTSKKINEDFDFGC